MRASQNPGPGSRLRSGAALALLVTLLLAILWPGGVVNGAPLVQSGTPAPGNVLFEDDFDTYSNRWGEVGSPKTSVAYAAGTLTLRVVSPGVSVWSVPDFRMATERYTLLADVLWRGGSPDAQLGCVVAYDDDDDFFAFWVTPEGAWQFARYDAGDWIDLTPPQAAALPELEPGATITLRVDVQDTTLVFWVDEQALGSVTLDEALPGNGFGVITRAGHGYVEVAFDTVIVSELVGENERGTTN